MEENLIEGAEDTLVEGTSHTDMVVDLRMQALDSNRANYHQPTVALLLLLFARSGLCSEERLSSLQLSFRKQTRGPENEGHC